LLLKSLLFKSLLLKSLSSPASLFPTLPNSSPEVFW